ncbi:uncharacterized protein LOC124461254 [Drosophila willistoni]|uniref:uncharacterized protein LOC124461254 n=1 Tax=Drosophila willistoni TaxID=7260 RepID=UPI001F082DFC|nr:uncharacterized protein LOC124461254 [Drosophila willistoni]
MPHFGDWPSGEGHLSDLCWPAQTEQSGGRQQYLAVWPKRRQFLLWGISLCLSTRTSWLPRTLILSILSFAFKMANLAPRSHLGWLSVRIISIHGVIAVGKIIEAALLLSGKFPLIGKKVLKCNRLSQSIQMQISWGRASTSSRYTIPPESF